MIWNGFAIHNNLIKVSTVKAVLIALPSNSRYAGFSFWHPRKLVKNGSMSMVLYNDDFIFRLKKYGQGRFNQKEVLEEVELSAKDMIDIYSMFHSSEDVPMLHVPERLEAEKTEAISELCDE